MKILNKITTVLCFATFWMIFDEYFRISAFIINLYIWVILFIVLFITLACTIIYNLFKKKYALSIYKKSTLMVLLSVVFCYLQVDGHINQLKFKLSLPYLNAYVAKIQAMTPQQKHAFKIQQGYDEPTAGAKIGLFNFYQVEISDATNQQTIYFVNGYGIDPYGFEFDKTVTKEEALAQHWRAFK
jgi:hypothetical protein